MLHHLHVEHVKTAHLSGTNFSGRMDPHSEFCSKMLNVYVHGDAGMSDSVAYKLSSMPQKKTNQPHTQCFIVGFCLFI